MAEPENLQVTDLAGEILRTEIIVNQALIDILLGKKIISVEELVTGIRKIRLEEQALIGKSNKVISLKM